VVSVAISAKQQDYLLNSTHSFNISSGVVSSGKTFAQILRWIDFIYNETPNNCLLMMSGKTKESLYDNVIRDMQSLDSINDLKYDKNPQRLTVLSKNIEIACASADNERSWGRIQGKTVYGWLADEIVQHPKQFVKMAHSRCRGGGVPSPKFWTCNPDSPSHFIKTDYIDNQKIDVKNWFFGFQDNPLLSQEYIDELKNSYTGVFYQRFCEGKWVLAEGVIYDKFHRAQHVVDTYPVREVNEYIIGIDWGYANDHPLVLSLIACTNDAYYVIDELYIEQQLIDKTLVEILLNRGWLKLPFKRWNGYKWVDTEGRPSAAYPDSARPDLINQFYKLTNIPTYPAVKDVEDGIQAVQRRFVPQGNNRYGLYFLSKCINHIREFELYRWDQFQSGDGKNVPLKKNDHCPDSIRYAIYTRDRGRARQIKDFRKAS